MMVLILWRSPEMDRSDIDRYNETMLAQLLPSVEDKVRTMIALCEQRGVTLRITSAYRSYAHQDALYQIGRSGRQGRIVTNAKGGHSWHNFRRAADVWPAGMEEPPASIWSLVGEAAREVGLEWGGDWKSFSDECHVQLTEGLTLGEARSRWELENGAV